MKSESNPSKPEHEAVEPEPKSGDDTISVDLANQLGSLGLHDTLPSYPNCYPELNPVDIYRAHLTSILTKITGVEASIVYPALQWTQTLEKGDLVLPVPALRVKGKKPPELAAEWAEKVGQDVFCSQITRR
jgi:arginyl-tRNA synthetase